MESLVPDSQYPQNDIVPDSQQAVTDIPGGQELNLILFAVMSIVSPLVELILEHLNQDFVHDTKFLIRDNLNDHDRSSGRRSQLVWRQFMQQNLKIFRVLQFVLDSQPLRRILCPWYIKPRTIEWFYLYLDYTPTEDPERFRLFFRISPRMFYQICDLVRPDMASNAPVVFHSLPNRDLVVERQVAVALRRLATGDQLLGIGELFGLSTATASKVTWKFIQSFIHRARHFLRWPEGHDMDEVKTGFMDRWGFPNCCGAIDVTHFLIELPVGETATAYFDWKHNLSITMQAVVDCQCQFLDVIFIGTPGSVPDAKLLRTSAFYQNVVYDHSKLNGPQMITPSGYSLREYVIGDKGYPLYNWLIVPFPRNRSEANDIWNHWHSSARMCVERSFGRLKGMWRILSRQILRPKVERLASTVFACVLLHNMMLEQGEDFAPHHWNELPAQPDGYAHRPGRNYEMFAGGAQAREALRRPF